MAVFVIQREKESNFIRLLRTYVSYVNTEGMVNEAKKRIYFVSRKIKKKLKKIEASRKARINSKSRGNKKVRSVRSNKPNSNIKKSGTIYSSKKV